MTKWKKQCPRCGNDQFYAHRTGLWVAKKKNTLCRKCISDSSEYKKKLSVAQVGVPNINARRRPFESTYNELRRTAKLREIECQLTYDDYLKFTNDPNCHYCGVEIEWQPHHGDRKNRKVGSNLDRIDSNKSYTIENCRVCCKVCNAVKNTFFSYEEMLRLGKIIHEINYERTK